MGKSQSFLIWVFKEYLPECREEYSYAEKTADKKVKEESTFFHNLSLVELRR